MTNRKRLLEIHGSPEAVSEYYRGLQKKSREHYKGTGGFHYLKLHDPKKHKEISSKGAKSYGKDSH